MRQINPNATRCRPAAVLGLAKTACSPIATIDPVLTGGLFQSARTGVQTNDPVMVIG